MPSSCLEKFLGVDELALPRGTCGLEALGEIKSPSFVFS
jgi:hypothetical protein